MMMVMASSTLLAKDLCVEEAPPPLLRHFCFWLPFDVECDFFIGIDEIRIEWQAVI